jgi:hypothetical protein
MALRERLRDFGAPNSGGNGFAPGADRARHREQIQANARVGLDAIDRGLAEIGDAQEFNRGVRQQGGQ